MTDLALSGHSMRDILAISHDADGASCCFVHCGLRVRFVKPKGEKDGVRIRPIEEKFLNCESTQRDPGTAV